ncbi:MAG TPA: ankyrin repeat domain-containing protein [Acholeplasmataceae bacterium]|nr:ankyrin repeat domain-containing protein [Acholeplasmataceae bacterium]
MGRIILYTFLVFGLSTFLIVHHLSNRVYSRDLIEAIEESDYEKLSILLDKKGNIDAKPYSTFQSFFLEIFNDPPLFYAVREGDAESVRLLLEHGADANMISDDYSPLMEASNSLKIERFEIAHLLLDYGADINFVDKWGNTPVLLFNFNHNSKDNYDDAYTLFLRFVSLGVIPDSSQGFTYGNFLLYAVTTNNVLIVDYLIHSMSYDIHSIGKDGASALIRATQYHAVLVVEYLIENGVDISYRDGFNKSAYDYAVEYNYTEIISILQD